VLWFVGLGVFFFLGFFYSSWSGRLSFILFWFRLSRCRVVSRLFWFGFLVG